MKTLDGILKLLALANMALGLALACVGNFQAGAYCGTVACFALLLRGDK